MSSKPKIKSKVIQVNTKKTEKMYKPKAIYQQIETDYSFENGKAVRHLI